MADIFCYRARDYTGRAVTGEIEAESRSDAAVALREKNYVIVDISEKTGRSKKTVPFFAAGVGAKDLSVYCRQFATMTETGVPLVDCLSILGRQTENRRLKAASGAIIKDLHRGCTLAESLQKHTGVFPAAFVKMVEAGESGGMLEQVFEWLSEQYEKEFAFREKIKAAAAYPAFVLSVTFAVAVIFLVAVVPGFFTVFQDLKVTVPFYTRVVFFVSGFASKYWHLLLLLPLVSFFLLVQFKQVIFKQAGIDQIVFKMPVAGGLMKKIVIAQFLRTFCTLLRGGIPVLGALEVAKKSSSSSVIVKVLDDAQNGIREGQGLSGQLEKSGFFPPLVTGMIAVGEQTGAMDRLLEKVALYYEKEVEYAASSLSSVLEPLLVLGAGIVVGFVVISIMVPMFNMVSSIR
ncbi:MAG TPA: type II secretion system F family protein [Bacillota bacterium]|nr:type II secretion system F family protein [Bacillota bacterium]